MSKNIQSMLFSKTSIAVHSIWFFIWLVFQLNINLLTLIVSLEAIYITLFIGLEQRNLHQVMKSHKPAMTKLVRDVNKVIKNNK